MNRVGVASLFVNVVALHYNAYVVKCLLMCCHGSRLTDRVTDHLAQHRIEHIHGS